MASKEVESKEVTDPVGASFLALVGILEALTKTQPGIAGPKADEALAAVRTYWTTPEPDPPVVREGERGEQ